MKLKTVVLVSISVPLVSAALTAGSRYVWDSWFGVPILECPRSLNLGEHKRGDIAIGSFQIKNVGKEILWLSDFQTSCSCAGVEQEIDGTRYRIKSLTLAPGQEARLFVRLGVGVRPGESQQVQVVFATNDPAHPQWLMEVIIPHVTGGCYPDPSAVVFGPLSPGEKKTQLVDLYDNGTSGRRIEKMYIDHPDYFTAVLLPLTEKEKQCVHPTAGKLFARVQITPCTERIGRFDGEVQITMANETHIERIPVLGEIVGTADCRPAALVLPRRVENRSVRTGQVLIFNRQEKPIDVAVDFAPPDLVAEVQIVSGHPNQRLLAIEWRPMEKHKRRSTCEQRVRLRVSCEGENSDLEVPIILAEN